MKLIKASVIAFSLFTCHAASAGTEDTFIGIWAMHPLNNGIANVVVFKENNESTLYPFTCSWEDGTYEKSPPEESKYVIDQENKIIKITSPQENFELAILEKNEKLMQLAYVEYDLNMKYYNVTKVEPLCNIKNMQ